MDIVYRYDPFQPIDARRGETIDEAMQVLRDGNIRFASVAEKVREQLLSGKESEPIVIPSNPLSLGFPLVPGKAPMQNPFGIVLGCSDARAPIELIFDQSQNELFVVRVAGNVLGTECLGSIEYASRNFDKSVRLVVVLGHTGCGAVTAAVDLYLDPDTYGAIAVTHALRSIVDRILVAVRIADKALERRCGKTPADDPGYREALLQMAVYLNAALTAHDLARELEDTDENRFDVVYGVYNLLSQRVHVAPREDATFGRAPKTSAEFTSLSDRLADSILSCGILGSDN